MGKEEKIMQVDSNQNQQVSGNYCYLPSFNNHSSSYERFHMEQVSGNYHYLPSFNNHSSSYERFHMASHQEDFTKLPSYPVSSISNNETNHSSIHTPMYFPPEFCHSHRTWNSK
mmetsp:Transcript_31591/g.72352  ORF Transcript_31591/g.72352 Transcript_31591/m.72352 type:complete len:114 (-) Transcript_31591:257-598(-)